MPKDDSHVSCASDSIGNNTGSVEQGTSQVPLKRGDACLYCRKRRIRCTAEKPSCQHCRKLKRECVYDSGKPVSRVKQLEEKVLELEEMLKGGGGGGGRGVSETSRRGSEEGSQQQQQRQQQEGGAQSGYGGVPEGLAYNIGAVRNSGFASGTGTGTTQASSTSFSYSNGNGTGNSTSDGNLGWNGAVNETFDFNMLDSLSTENPIDTSKFFAFGASMVGGQANIQPTQSINHGGPTGFPPTPAFDFSTLDPNFMNLLSTFDNTFQTPQQNSQSDNTRSKPITQTTSSTGLTPFLNNDDYSQNIVPTSTTAQSAVQLPAATLGHGQDINQSSRDFSTYSGTSLPFPLQPSNQAPQNQTQNQDNGQFQRQVSPLQGNNANASYNDYRSYVADTDGTGPQMFSGLQQHQHQHQHQQQQQQQKGYNAVDVNGSGPSSTTQSSTYTSPLSMQNINDSSTSIGHTMGMKSSEAGPDSAGLGAPSDHKLPMAAMGLDAGGYELVGGWFDANDLPKVARDHLLDIFFTGMKMFGLEFHVPRFFASLTLPVSKRPHPCLLYSMYLLASRVSSSASIRALEKHFYSIASRQLDESISKADRLFDATRAATLLAVYKYSNAKYHEGWMMVGLAARLGISCGLHQISSSVFKESPLFKNRAADLGSIMRQRSYVLPPPADAIELGERIWAFWSIFIVERCGSIAAQWPPSISDDIVITPYPKPLYEYELGLVSHADDRSISDLYEPPAESPTRFLSSYTIIRIRGLAVLERASKLMYLKPEPEYEQLLREQLDPSSSSPSGPIDEYLYIQNVNLSMGGDWYFGEDLGSMFDFEAAASDGNGNGNGTGNTQSASSKVNSRAWMKCAKVRTPKAYEEVKMALKKLELDLPVECRNNWEVWNEHERAAVKPMRSDFFSLHFILGCAWMFLFDIFSFNAENVEAVNVARRMTHGIRVTLMGSPGMITDFDVFIAMTWSFVSKILIRDVKRLEAKGDMLGAAEIEADVEIVIQALKMFGNRHSIAGMQALRAEKWRQSTADEMKSMEGDDVEESHGTKVMQNNMGPQS